jgi:AcrR family transcriptional regulator
MKKHTDDFTSNLSKEELLKTFYKQNSRLMRSKKIEGSVSSKLLKIGAEHAIKYGMASISIRAICAEANVNLGLFSYYFKTKNRFIHRLVSQIYVSVAKEMSKVLQEPNCLLRLKKVILKLMKMIHTRKNIYEALVRDVDFNEKFYQNLCSRIKRKWMSFLYKLIDDCKKTGYFQDNLNDETLIALFFGASGFYMRLMEDKYDTEEIYIKFNDFFEVLLKAFAYVPPPISPQTPTYKVCDD